MDIGGQVYIRQFITGNPVCVTILGEKNGFFVAEVGDSDELGQPFAIFQARDILTEDDFIALQCKELRGKIADIGQQVSDASALASALDILKNAIPVPKAE